MKIIFQKFLLIALLFTFFIACDKHELTTRTDTIALISPVEPGNPDYITPGLQTPLIKVSVMPKTALETRNVAASTLTPVSFTKTTFNGEQFTENKTAELHLPLKADVNFHFDLSGSMSGEISAVASNAGTLFSSLAANIDDFQAGVTGGISDFNVYENLTAVSADFENGLASLSLGSGPAENYALHFTQIANSLSWRPNAAKTVLAFVDELPQEYGGYTLANGLAALATADIKLIVVFSGPSDLEYAAWTALSTGATPFNLVRINTDGSLPQSVDLADFILNSIQDAFCNVASVQLCASPSSYQSWITINPVSYSNVNVCPATPLSFTINYTVPANVAPGTYNFQILLKGDGLEYAHQDVSITVVPKPIAFDFHPTSCPNPLNTKSGGLAPAAILGTATLNVMDIDLNSIRINGVAVPVRITFKDISTPQLPYIDKALDVNNCNTIGPDGYKDLEMKFNTKDIVAALGSVSSGDVLKLYITARLNDGTYIHGEDIIKIGN